MASTGSNMTVGISYGYGCGGTGYGYKGAGYGWKGTGYSECSSYLI